MWNFFLVRFLDGSFWFLSIEVYGRKSHDEWLKLYIETVTLVATRSKIVPDAIPVMASLRRQVKNEIVYEVLYVYVFSKNNWKT